MFPFCSDFKIWAIWNTLRWNGSKTCQPCYIRILITRESVKFCWTKYSTFLLSCSIPGLQTSKPGGLDAYPVRSVTLGALRRNSLRLCQAGDIRAWEPYVFSWGSVFHVFHLWECTRSTGAVSIVLHVLLCCGKEKSSRNDRFCKKHF